MELGYIKEGYQFWKIKTKSSLLKESKHFCWPDFYWFIHPLIFCMKIVCKNVISERLLVLQGGRKKSKSSKFLSKANVLMYFCTLRCTLCLTVKKKQGVDWRESSFCVGEVELPNFRRIYGKEFDDSAWIIMMKLWNILTKLVLGFKN